MFLTCQTIRSSPKYPPELRCLNFHLCLNCLQARRSPSYLTFRKCQRLRLHPKYHYFLTCLRFRQAQTFLSFLTCHYSPQPPLRRMSLSCRKCLKNRRPLPLHSHHPRLRFLRSQKTRSFPNCLSHPMIRKYPMSHFHLRSRRSLKNHSPPLRLFLLKIHYCPRFLNFLMSLTFHVSRPYRMSLKNLNSHSFPHSRPFRSFQNYHSSLMFHENPLSLTHLKIQRNRYFQKYLSFHFPLLLLPHPRFRWYRKFRQRLRYRKTHLSLKSPSFRKNHPCQKIRWCHEYQNCLSYLMNLTCRGSRQHHLCRMIHWCLSCLQRPLSRSFRMSRQCQTFLKIRWSLKCLTSLMYLKSRWNRMSRWNRLFRMFLTCPSSRCWRFRMYQTYHGNRPHLRSG
jgi:hypothetical protein